MPLITWLIIAAYLSLLIEITVFPIPSEASTYQLLFKSEEDSPTAPASALQRARNRSLVSKLIQFTFPTALGIGMFLIPLAAILRPEILDHLLPIKALQKPVVQGLGSAFVIFGRALTFYSVLQLRKSQRSGVLSAKGLFTLSRNPGLVGMYIFYIGNALLFPCVVLFVGFFPYIMNMHRRVLMEETHLAQRIGPDYRAYLASVPRYVPLFSSHP